jgi:hypothetical protein
MWMMQTERRSIWIIIGLFLLAGLWRLNLEIGWGMWYFRFSHFHYQWWEPTTIVLRQMLLKSPACCAIFSALVYAYLHYRHRHLTLWLMTLQMMTLLLVAYYPWDKTMFILLAWMMLLSVISRSGKKQKRQPQDDLLDDI